MSFLGSDKSPKQILIEQEGEVAEEIWELVQGEEADIEKLKELERQDPEESTIKKAKRALNSLAVMVEEDLREIKSDENQIEQEIESADFDQNFEAAAEHNLRLLEFVTEELAEEDEELEESLSEADEEDAKREVEDLLKIEDELERYLEAVKAAMKNGEGTDFDQGWIDLSKFT